MIVTEKCHNSLMFEVPVSSFAIFINTLDEKKLIAYLLIHEINYEAVFIGSRFGKSVLQFSLADEEKVLAILKHIEIKYRIVHSNDQPPSDQELEFVPPQPKCQQAAKRAPQHRFTPEDDLKLLQLYSEYKLQWHKIAEQLPPFNATQCRDRYHLYINPKFDQKPFTMEEEEQLHKLVQQYGRNFALISQKFMKNRSPVQLKVNYNSMEKSQEKVKEEISKQVFPIPQIIIPPLALINQKVNFEELLSKDE